jgi:hypothetical protein
MATSVMDSVHSSTGQHGDVEAHGLCHIVTISGRQ